MTIWKMTALTANYVELYYEKQNKTALIPIRSINYIEMDVDKVILFLDSYGEDNKRKKYAISRESYDEYGYILRPGN